MTGDEKYLTGRHAVITGGGRGIGAAIAAELARLGATLTLMGRDRHTLEQRATALRKQFGVEVAAFPCDISDEAAVAGAFELARSTHGHPYALVNNAGQAESAPFLDTSRETWDRMLAVNLTGAYLCAKQVLPAMIEAREGRIISISSTAGLIGYKKTAAYTASKHGLIGLTRALALETAKLGITVNVVCPGYTNTEMAATAVSNLVTALGKTKEEAGRMVTGNNPRGHLIEPAEVANAVAWLCSPNASAVTGQAIVVAGGEVM